LQLDEVGEVMVEVGAPNGVFGSSLSPDQLATTIARLKETAAAKGAVATVVSQAL